MSFEVSDKKSAVTLRGLLLSVTRCLSLQLLVCFCVVVYIQCLNYNMLKRVRREKAAPGKSRVRTSCAARMLLKVTTECRDVSGERNGSLPMLSLPLDVQMTSVMPVCGSTTLAELRLFSALWVLQGSSFRCRTHSSAALHGLSTAWGL